VRQRFGVVADLFCVVLASGVWWEADGFTVHLFLDQLSPVGEKGDEKGDVGSKTT